MATNSLFTISTLSVWRDGLPEVDSADYENEELPENYTTMTLDDMVDGMRLFRGQSLVEVFLIRGTLPKRSIWTLTNGFDNQVHEREKSGNELLRLYDGDVPPAVRNNQLCV